jgi:hypothetical protein
MHSNGQAPFEVVYGTAAVGVNILNHGFSNLSQPSSDVKIFPILTHRSLILRSARPNPSFFHERLDIVHSLCLG